MKEEDRLPQEYLDFIRAFVANKDGRDGRYPDLADMLVALWNDGDPAAPAPFLPKYPLGVALLAAYVNFSRTKWWAWDAWDALDRLFVMLMERREPIPELLQIHVKSRIQETCRSRIRERHEAAEQATQPAVCVRRTPGICES